MEENSISSVISKMIFDFKTESLEWNKVHQDELLTLKKHEMIAQKEIEQKLEKMAVAFKGEKERKQIEEEFKTKQFQEFLISIDEMKANLLKCYSDMPKPIVLMIHSKATELLSQAWHNEDFTIQKISQGRFLELILAVSEDMYSISENSAPKGLLPQKTIDYIATLNK